jgi:hypothetical protein
VRRRLHQGETIGDALGKSACGMICARAMAEY